MIHYPSRVDFLDRKIDTTLTNLHWTNYCRVSYVRGELIFAYFAVPYMREIKVPRKNKPKTLFRT